MSHSITGDTINMANTTIDRKAAATALAKAIAFKQCDQQAKAELWAKELVRLLQCSNILKS